MHISSCLEVLGSDNPFPSHMSNEISFTFDVHLWMGKMQQRDQLLWLLLAFPGYYQISLTSWAWSMVIAFSDRDEMVLLQCMFPLDVSPLSCCGWDILSRMKPDQILWKSHSGKAKCSIKYFHVWLIIVGHSRVKGINGWWEIAWDLALDTLRGPLFSERRINWRNSSKWIQKSRHSKLSCLRAQVINSTPFSFYYIFLFYYFIIFIFFYFYFFFILLFLLFLLFLLLFRIIFYFIFILFFLLF